MHGPKDLESNGFFFTMAMIADLANCDADLVSKCGRWGLWIVESGFGWALGMVGGGLGMLAMI